MGSSDELSLPETSEERELVKSWKENEIPEFLNDASAAPSDGKPKKSIEDALRKAFGQKNFAHLQALGPSMKEDRSAPLNIGGEFPAVSDVSQPGLGLNMGQQMPMDQEEMMRILQQQQLQQPQQNPVLNMLGSFGKSVASVLGFSGGDSPLGSSNPLMGYQNSMMGAMDPRMGAMDPRMGAMDPRMGPIGAMNPLAGAMNRLGEKSRPSFDNDEDPDRFEMLPPVQEKTAENTSTESVPHSTLSLYWPTWDDVDEPFKF